MEPKSPYRIWRARPSSEPSQYELVVTEPDGFVMKMRSDLKKEEAEKLAAERTDVERRAQLARENH